MKPLNSSLASCDPISSSCIIWQGPDIECIKLCKGDSVSQVVFRLATELCEVMNILKISSYDLSCFNLTSCQPKDFQQLIQFILKRLCTIEDCAGLKFNCDECTPGTIVSSPASPSNPNLSIAPCFYFVNSIGDTITYMSLTDYVQAIGNKVCNIVDGIVPIKAAIVNLDGRVTELENAPLPTLRLPDITPTCVLPPESTIITDVVIALETQFCQLVSATGSPTTIYQNIVKQCAGLNNSQVLSGTYGTMSGIPGWSNTVNSLAQGFGNLWLAMCDVRAAIKTLQTNIMSGCDGINLSLTAILTGTDLSIYVNGTIPPGFAQCSGNTPVTITDAEGNLITVNMDLIGYLDNPTGFPVSLASTPINISTDLTIEMSPCLNNGSTSTRCESYLSYVMINNALCPTINFILTETEINYSFTSNVGNYNYNIELWNQAGSVNLSSQVQVISGAITVSGVFSGLTADTTYLIRISVQPTACMSCIPTVCPFNIVVTNPVPCIPPVGVSATIVI